MSQRNVLQTTFDEFAKEAGFTKRSGAWCRHQHESVAVIELQKSQYGPQYFVNVALWLLELGDVQCPKEHACHLRTRLTRLLPERKDELNALLDLDDASMTESHRRESLEQLLRDRLLPLLDTCSTLDGIRSLKSTGVLGAFLTTGPAQQVLEPTAP